ncbi:DinB family protein [Labrys okinawensis]|uniref:DinB family protein n=1 Tax=Labrys okinawensis TaxID=346911 RepID=UPI0039BC702D
MNAPLRTLYGYHAWANAELVGKLALLDPVAQKSALDTTLRLVNHYHVVARIFAAHLAGSAHPYTSDNTVETPALADLRASLAAIDRWYLDYVGEVSPETLREPVSFTFTDGDRGCMTREEMLLHVAVHATIHRGEACRILAQLGITPPWDTLAVYLHQMQPGRRE